MKLIWKVIYEFFGLVRKVLRIMSTRLFIILAALALELIWIIALILILNEESIYVTYVLTFIALITVLWLVSQNLNPGYKLMWTFCILVFPVVGIILYAIFGQSRLAHKFRIVYDQVLVEHKDIFKQENYWEEYLEKENPGVAGQCRYLRKYAHAPLYSNTQTEYFAVGEDWFAKFLEELKKAEHYIFMEYFIIGEGYMWDSILDVLKEKAANGVEVRLIYDDLGCVNTLPSQYYRTLQSYGIRCASFNQFRPVLNVVMNNRDHRKITVIDGHTAFTGGINLADEYINKKMRFGHWKDSGVWLHGDAVWTFTVMFLQMWTVITRTSCDFEKYRPHLYHMGPFTADGLVQPYGDSPMDSETVGASVYLNIINYAKRYLYIFTPYLIPDNETLTALCQAAKRGVDVRIVTPEIPDKKSVFLLTQSYYEPLLEAGVRIYQYLPGFIHSKSFVCDDEMATCGTFNVDYRSLYLHFECGVFLYKNSSVMQIKQDALDTFEVSKEMDLETVQARNIFVRMFQSVLRLFAPML